MKRREIEPLTCGNCPHKRLIGNWYVCCAEPDNSKDLGHTTEDAWRDSVCFRPDAAIRRSTARVERHNATIERALNAKTIQTGVPAA